MNYSEPELLKYLYIIIFLFLSVTEGDIGDREGETSDREGETGDREGEAGDREGEAGDREGEIGDREGEIVYIVRVRAAIERVR